MQHLVVAARDPPRPLLAPSLPPPPSPAAAAAAAAACPADPPPHPFPHPHPPPPHPQWHRYERSSAFTGRAIRLPETAQLNDIKARYENGVLSLDVPKNPAAEGTKRIAID